MSDKSDGGKPFRKSIERLTVTPIPCNFTVEEEEASETVINSQSSAYKEIALMSKHVRGLVRATNTQAGYVAQIPEIREAVKLAQVEAEKANQRIALVDMKLSTELKNADKRVSRVEERVEERSHECTQASVIVDLKEEVRDRRKDSTESIRTGEVVRQQAKDIGELEKKVKSYSSARRSFLLGIGGTIVAVLGSVGSLIWFLAALSTKVENEQDRWQERHKHMQAQIEKLDKSFRPLPPQREFCDGLPKNMAYKIKETLPRQDWPDCLH